MAQVINTVLALVVLAASPAGAEEAALRRYSLINDAGRAEGRPALDLRETGVVFYGDPGAAFTRQETGDLSSDDAAKVALLTRVFFITGAENLPAAAEWNRSSPYEYAVEYSTGDWPELALSPEPHIFFYRDGAPVCETRGLAGAARFRACLEKAGLFDAPARLESAARLIWLPRSDDLRDEIKRLTASEFKALLALGAYAPEKLAGCDDRTLRNAFDLADTFNFYSHDAAALAAQGLALAELDKRGLAGPAKVGDLHQRLLNAKAFDKAEALRSLYPAVALPAVPPVRGTLKTAPGETAVYYTADGKAELAVEKLRDDAARIVVAARPGCHFADAALTALEKDRELGPVFRKYALPLCSVADFAGIGDWNASHELRYRLTVADSDWPGVDFSLSPTFYFIRGGKILHTVQGWVEEDRFGGIYEGLKKLFPGRKFRHAPPAKKPAAKEEGERRRRIPPQALGAFLKGLGRARTARFCASIRFSGGVYAGAETGEIREVFGEDRVKALEVYLSGGRPLSPAAGGTLGELLKGLDEEQLARSCSSMTFYGGRFGGLNFSDVWDVLGEGFTDKLFAYFTAPDGEPAK